MRVDICYRPLRIGWAIRSNDLESFRRAVRYSFALWGGRFNPVLVVDRDAEARQLIELFRVDLIIPLGDSDLAKEFPAKYSHLIKPFFDDAVFVKGNSTSPPYTQVLDVRNALVHNRVKPEWNVFKARGFHVFKWQQDDPLTDVFLTQFGGYPSIEEVGTDYLALAREALESSDFAMEPKAPIPAKAIECLTISYLARHGLRRHYNVAAGWDTPGFFVGNAANLDDLVCYWNLRACDVRLWFVAPEHLERYAELIPAWETAMRDDEGDHHIAVWTRQEDLNEACRPFAKSKLRRYPISDATWNGLNVRAPTMHFGQGSVLGVVGTTGGIPKASFALPDKPFCEDTWFSMQQLVASVSFVGNLYGHEQYTFQVPYVPELNEFYARTMHFDYNKVRIEPGRIGIVIGADDHDTFLYALPVGSLMERVFQMADYEVKLSSAGLVTRQLIFRLGGLQGARIFKIPGVRRLLRTYGPGKSFTKLSALQIIGSKDPDQLDASFADHVDLYIEPRPIGAKLQPPAVFGHLVEKGLFRIGVDLLCPGCSMTSWTPLDKLREQVVCDLCGHEYTATRQLADQEKWHYRRSGVLGAERNAQGAVPVSLTLQQLDTSLHSGLSGNMYSPSLNLMPLRSDNGTLCEVDFVWMIPRSYPRRTAVILGECKDHVPITTADIANLKRVSDSLPERRFKAFVLLSQLTPFSTDQIESAKSLNDEHRKRAILLTAQELEPYFIYERAKIELGRELHGGTPEDMAEATTKIYFK
ncbi:MAG: hypothetical protein ABR899_00605 [Candidatus Krumholzibacteriaceae bacterium]|jgi:hypothetical protein